MSPDNLESSGSAVRKVTPACSESSPAGFRAFRGSCLIGLVPKAFPTEASVVFSWGAEAATVMDLVSVATVSNTTGSSRLVLTSKVMPSMVTELKPGWVADRV